MRATEAFRRQLLEWNLDVGPEAQEALFLYARLLSEYDRANVVGTRGFDEVLRRHVLDSLSCLLFSGFTGAKRVADVGSGGGLPGIPLAIVLPQVEVTLFESVGKKVEFLRYVIAELRLDRVRVMNERVEEAGRQEGHRGEYDICTVRAVSRLSVIAEYCLPLLRVGGHVVAMKGRRDSLQWDEAGRALKALGGSFLEDMQVPSISDMEQRNRRLVLFRKVVRTPKTYPRRTGVPARKPLGAS